jgi:hypothetical protein
MSIPFSLYLDHQSIAPLVRLLERAVEVCQQGQEVECSYSPTKLRHMKSG